jgi:hypothetical protein
MSRADQPRTEVTDDVHESLGLRRCTCVSGRDSQISQVSPRLVSQVLSPSETPMIL